ncbi:MAG: signal recognition particle protein Srp54 [Halobacteria archaeon]
MLDKLGSSLRDALKKLATLGRVDKEAVEATVKDVQRALLSSDVNVKLVMEMSNSIRKRALDEKPAPGMTARDHVLKVVYEEMVKLLGKPAPVELKPQTILLVGLYGAGKTTTAGKIARHFQRKGLRAGAIGADIHRPAAMDQLKQLCDKLRIPCHVELGAKDPVAVARKGREALKGQEVVVVDTAGRHALDRDLIREMKAIAAELKPDHRWLVMDGAMGQAAREHARAFHEAVGLTGVVVTKLDGTAKGGGALAAVAESGASIAFLGAGEHPEDLEKFEPDGFVSRLLGMGDLKALLERAQEALEGKEIDVKSLARGRFTLDDLYDQLKSLDRLGPLKNVLGMLPIGNIPGVRMDDKTVQSTKERLRRFRVVMDSMTAEERANPKLISGSRVVRIARGSGSRVEEVRELLKYHKTMQQALKQMTGSRESMRKMMRQFGG